MNENEKRSLTVYLIALVVIIANLIVLSVIYQVPFLAAVPSVKKALPFLSMAAVYPLDLFRTYLKDTLSVQFFWILSVMISGFGLLLFNRFSRIVFIVFNILHFVALGLMTVFSFGQPLFLGNFFMWYFNLVAFLFYVGYLTLPEVRAQFERPTKEIRFDLWFLQARRKVTGTRDAEGCYNLALAYRRLERMREAVEFLRRAVAIRPTHADYHFHLGEVLYQYGDPASAALSLKEAIRLDPLHARARSLLAAIYEHNGSFEDAAQSFRRVTFIEPRNTLALRQLGINCFRAGHWQEAQQALSKSAELDPTDAETFFYLGLLSAKDEHKGKNAQEYFKKALRLKPDHTRAHQELGHLYIRDGDFKGAVRMFRDVARLDPADKHARYHLGFSYAMLGDLASARREYDYLKGVDPDLAKNLAMLIHG